MTIVNAKMLWVLGALCISFSMTPSVDAVVSTGGDCQSMDLVLVVPTPASSVAGPADPWVLFKSYLVSVLNQLNIGNFTDKQNGIRVSLITYRDHAVLNFDLKKYSTKQQVIAAVNALQQLPGDLSDIGEALGIVNSTLLTQFDERSTDANGAGTVNVVLAMFDNIADDATVAEHYESAFNLRGIQFLTVGLTSAVDTENDLSALNSSYNRLYTDYTTLVQAVNDTVDLLCSHRPPFCNVVADIGFILDESTSIVAAKGGNLNWYSILGFVEATVSTFPISPTLTRIGVVHFASTASFDFGFANYSNSADLQRAVGRLTLQSGETNTADGFDIANTRLFPSRRSGVKTVAIVITDGQPNIKTSQTFTRANETKALGIEVIAVGITNAVDINTLNQLASSPSSVFVVTDYASIENTLGSLTALLCAEIKTTAIPPSTSTTTTTTTTTTTPPTTTRPQSPCPGSFLDLVFVLEAGNFIPYNRYPSLLAFVNNLTLSLPVGPGATQVGVMTYGTLPATGIKLGQYTDLQSLTNAVLAIPQNSGSNPDMTLALLYLQNTMFSPTNGARSGARRIAIVVAPDNPSNPLTNEFAADLVRRAGIDLILIYIGTFNDPYTFRLVPSFTYDQNKNLYTVANYSALITVSPTLHDVLCQLNNLCTATTCQNGGTCTNIIGPSYMCTCTPNFAGRNCERGCSNPGDLVFLLDSSGSIGKQNFQTLTSFVSSVANNLDLDGILQRRPAGTLQSGWQVGMMTFSTQVNFFYNLNTTYGTKANLLKDLQVWYIDGSTATADAINNASTVLFSTANGMRSNVPHYLVVLTDGLSNVPPATWVAAMNARNLANQISIIAIGVGTAYNYNELQGIASAPTDLNVLLAPNYSYLNDTLAGIVADKLCRNTDACSSNPCQNGAACKSVVSGYLCTCPDNFQGFNCQWNCPSLIDLVLVIDSSGSIQQTRLDSIKSFLVALISNLDVEPTKTRVGAVFFSNNATVQFTLDQYSNRQDVIQAIINTPFVGGRTNIADGMRKARQNVLTLSGDRPNVQNLVLLFSDGNHNIDTGNTMPENRLLKATGGSSTSWGYTSVITVSVGADGFVDFGMMNALASEPYPIHVFNVTSYKNLLNLTSPVVGTVCNLINNCQPNPCQGGATCNNMYGMNWCSCPSSSSGYTCERQCNGNYDVVFVLDLSGSIDDVNQYYTIVNFTRAVVVGLGAGRGNVQVGVVTFSTNATHEFYLNSFTNAGTLAVWQAISFYRSGGLTNIGLAMTYAGQQLSAANGARAGVSQIVVFVSDGLQTTGPDGVTNANLLKSANSNLQVFSVGVSDTPNVGVLQQISSSPTSNSYTLSIPTSPANAYLATASQLLTRLNC